RGKTSSEAFHHCGDPDSHASACVSCIHCEPPAENVRSSAFGRHEFNELMPPEGGTANAFSLKNMGQIGGP
ncbi:MAG TPA: hypothetical protein VFS27_10250, partial [Blastocatellia bacterium]|nr:hypothetical protein [Blastocatellia bacterium]